MGYSNETVSPVMRDGYDIPLYGIEDGRFYFMHIPAVVCIVASFVSALVVIVSSCHHNKCRLFYQSWTKSERFIVYMAICDGLFNISHFADHMHILVTKAVVMPKELCQWYGFNLVVFITAQYLMVNLVAVNAFMLIYFDRNLNLGGYDWKLLTWIFGVPFVGALLAAYLGQLGPTGIS